MTTKHPTPLTEEELREKINKVMIDFGIDFYEGNLRHRPEQRAALIKDFQDDILNLILADRKACREQIRIMGKTPEEIMTILTALELERIADMEMTMGNLGDWVELLKKDMQDSAQKAMHQSIDNLLRNQKEYK